MLADKTRFSSATSIAAANIGEFFWLVTNLEGIATVQWLSFMSISFNSRGCTSLSSFCYSDILQRRVCIWLTCRLTYSESQISSDVRGIQYPVAVSRKKCCVFRQTQHYDMGWREINQQDANNPMFIIKPLSQHFSGIIMPFIRRARPCITAYGVLHCLCCAQPVQNTICSNTRSCSPDDGHNDARNMLR